MRSINIICNHLWSRASLVLFNLILKLLIDDRKWVLVAEDFLSGCDFGDTQSVWHDVSTGLFEIAHDINVGVFRAENKDIIICTLGRADIRRGRSFAAMVEKVITAGKTHAPRTQFVLTGPVPNTEDGERMLERMDQARHYMEERLSIETNFHFCRMAERLLDRKGVRPCMLTDEGVTPRGAVAIVKELLDFANNLGVSQ